MSRLIIYFFAVILLGSFAGTSLSVILARKVVVGPAEEQWARELLTPSLRWLKGELDARRISAEQLEDHAKALRVAVTISNAEGLRWRYPTIDAKRLGALRSGGIELLALEDDDLPADSDQFPKDGYLAVTRLATPLLRGARPADLLAIGFPDEPPPLTSRLVFVVVIVATTAALLTGLILGLPLVRKLRKLDAAARQVQQGDFSGKVDSQGSDIFAELAQRFNDMTAELDRHRTSQEELFRAIAHELRTPMSRIRFSIDLAAEETDPELLAKYHTTVDKSLDLLDSLTDELLTYARFGAELEDLDMKPFDATEAIRELAELVCHRPEIEVEVRDAGTAPRVCANPRTFQRAISNLLVNAQRFAEGQILVHLHESSSGDEVIIDIIDDGPGVPGGREEEIFDPFVRGDTSRDRRTGGSGLGLWIVRQVLSAHGGRVWATTTEDGRTCFRSAWPDQRRCCDQSTSIASP